MRFLTDWPKNKDDDDDGNVGYLYYKNGDGNV